MFSRYFAMALFGVALISVPASAQTTTGTPDASSNTSHVVAGQSRSSKLIAWMSITTKKKKSATFQTCLSTRTEKFRR